MTRIIIQVKDYESGEVTSYKLMSTTKLGKMFNAHTYKGEALVPSNSFMVMRES